MNFAEFLHPITTAEFKTDYFGKRPLLIQGGKSFADLLSWNDLDDVLNDVANIPRLEVIGPDQMKIKPSDYAHEGGVWRRHVIDKKRLAEHWESGSTFILTQMGHANERISDLLGAIETELSGHHADGHAYFSSRPGSQSFPIHFDRPHNFIVQIIGRTEWRVFRETGTDPSQPTQKLDTFTPEIETVLSEGDVLYIPPMRYHEATRPLGPRVSLSIPFIAPSAVRPDAIPGRSVDRTRIKLSRV